MYALTLRQGKSVFVGKWSVYQFVIGVYHTRTLFMTFVILVHGHVLYQLKAHLMGELRCSCIAFQTSDKLCNIFLTLSFGFGTGCHFIILSFQDFLFRLILVEHIKSHIRFYPACNIILIHALNELVKLCNAAPNDFHTLGIGDVLNVQYTLSFV